MREFDLLQHVFKANASLPDRVTIPPGDDMGALRLGGRDLLVTVDQLIEGVHFNFDSATTEQVARKLVVRNLSDVAAMAAVPVGAVATATLNRSFGEIRTSSLFHALHKTVEQYDCPLIGGDIAMWDGPLHLTMTVFAEPQGVGPILRNTAQVGDGVFVTGEIGGAWDRQGGGPHLAAQPRIDLAHAIAQLPAARLHAMIDLSDGLAGDLKHICEMSHVGAEIRIDQLPERDTIAHDDRPTWEHAVCDGEDYELCFTAAGKLPESLLDVKITRIGAIVNPNDAAAPLIRWVDGDGQEHALKTSGWEHGH